MKNPLQRPKTLFELGLEADSYEQFGMGMRDFLHEFAYAKENGKPLAPLLSEEPPRMAARFPEGIICDAFIAATADFLSRKNGIDSPVWSQAEDRILEKPWFSSEYNPEFPELRLYLLRDTPSAFKDKNIFILERALSVA